MRSKFVDAGPINGGFTIIGSAVGQNRPMSKGRSATDCLARTRMAQLAVTRDSLDIDLARLKTVLQRVDLSERLQELAPEKAASLLREAQNELERQIRTLSLSLTRFG